MIDSQDIPADELQDLQSLLRLKNYEQPADGYFEDFVDEFHRRQREVAVGGERFSFLSKISSWFQELGAAKWAIGAGLAYAVLAFGFFGTIGNFGSKASSGIANDTEDILPEGSKLQHVELEKKAGDGAEGGASFEILPSEF